MAFLNPLFLLGGLAVAVPILLHLIRRRNVRKVEFPTLMFLRRIDKRMIRYQKLRHLLLLLLRVLAFLFLVFAFMRPYRKEAPVSAAAAEGSGTAHILALDNSMSMRYRDRWDRAKAAASDVVRRANAGDKFAILEFSDSSVIRTSLTSDRSAVLDEIENLPEPGCHPTRYVQALRAAEIVAREARTRERIVHLISDFQKNGWADEAGEFKIEAGIEIRSVDLGSDVFSNLAMQNVRAVEEIRNGASDLRILASVVEFGAQDREKIVVGLTVDDRRISEKTLAVPGGGSSEIEFSVPGLKGEAHSIVLEIEDSYLDKDNFFYMTIDGPQKTPVVVAENPAPPGRRAGSFFLSGALNVDRFSPYELVSVSAQDLDLSGGLLIWNDISADPPDIRKRLEDFVKNGGGMIVALGNSTRASEFNRGFGLWLPVKMEDGASPRASRSGTESADDFVLMTDIRTDHPIFQPFAKNHSGTFARARFYTHARITAGSGAEILARFDNGDPALISTGLGKGKVLVFASSSDDAGNDLPLHAVYAPYWQQMLRFLESFETRRYWLGIGDVMEPERILSRKASRRGRRAKDELSPGEAAVILDPSGRRLETPPGSSGIVVEKAGFYGIHTGGFNLKVAVNTVAAESDLAHRNAGEMTAALSTTGPAAPVADEDLNSGRKSQAGHIWIFLLLMALLFLIAESLISGVKTKSGENHDWTTRSA